MNVEIIEPIKVIPSNIYSLVIEDGTNTTHFWLKDGSYDGYDREFKS